jgi:type IV pilus assembly protein PilA
MNHKRGFTLLEILLVVGIIAILAGIVIVAINPSKQLATVRNTERKSDIKQVESAITQYYIDNSLYPSTITTDLKEICDTGSVSSTTVAVDNTPCGDLVNLSTLVPTYFTAVPKDPRATSTGNGSGYFLAKDTTNHIGVSASLAELGTVVSIGNVPGPTYDEFVFNGHTYQINPTIIPAGLTWGPTGVTTVIQSTTDGAGNTTALIQRELDFSESYPAAHAVNDLSDGGYTDWFLPSSDELFAALTEYQAQYPTNPTWGGFTDVDYYWSSTESTSDYYPDQNAIVENYLTDYNEVFKNNYDKSLIYFPIVSVRIKN